MPTILQEIPSQAITTLLTMAVLAGLSFLSKSIRQLVRFKRQEFELSYLGGSSGCDWDIQWENLRATFEVEEVHNDHLEGVVIKTNDVNPGTAFGTIKAEAAYTAISGPPPWQFRIESIVRAKTNASRSYLIKVSILRPRG